MPPQLGPMWEYPQPETHPQSQLIRATVMRPAELVKDTAFSNAYRRRVLHCAFGGRLACSKFGEFATQIVWTSNFI
jgi:hypothetical protein